MTPTARTASSARFRVAGVAVLVLAALLAIRFLAGESGGDPDEGPLRDPVSLPAPSDPEKVEYFFELFESGKQESIGTQRIPVWDRVGGAALKGFGPAALDYLLDEARYRDYAASPGLLINVLGLLRDMPDARADERFYPFLLRSLRPESLAREADWRVWADDLRQSVFVCFARFPETPAAPPCIEELRPGGRKNDLRRIAITTLLQVGRGDALISRWDDLPPTAAEPQPALKVELLMVLRKLAAPEALPEHREEAKRWTDTLRSLLASSELAVYRVWAATTLLRLGESGMESKLLAEYRRAADPDHLDHALGWSALRFLAEDRSDPEALGICLEVARSNTETFACITAFDILRRFYTEEPQALSLLWNNVEGAGWIHYPSLLSLLRVDRPRAVELLRRHLASADKARQGEAVRLARREHLTELGPDIIELARRAEGNRARIYLYAALTAMQVEAAYPLMLASLRPEEPAEMRTAAATGVIAFDHTEGLAVLGELLTSGDEVVRRMLFLRAAAGGPSAIPDGLWPAIMKGLRTLPGEDARLELLHVVRTAGRLETVGEALQAAYRFEPSRLVAGRIREVLLELAHR